MTYREILALVDTAGTEAVLGAAAALSQRFQAHVVALHAEPDIFIPFEMGMAGDTSVLIDIQQRNASAGTAAALRAIEQASQRSGVAIEPRVVRGSTESSAVLHSRYADLVVMGLGAPTSRGTNAIQVAWETIVLSCGRPVLAVPPGRPGRSIGQRILVAWRPTREATRAVHDAMPFLAGAEAVQVLTLNPDAATKRDAGADIGHHLARHGIKVEAVSDTVDEAYVGKTVLDAAMAFGADLLVAGAYGHTRLREYLLGGTTMHLATHAQIPLLVSH